MDDIEWIQNWYNSQCDGDWEHDNGIQIGTIDNPGWYIKICIEDTELDNFSFNKILIERSESDWIRCFIKEKIFEGVGGPLNLPEILLIFRKWAESCPKKNDSRS